MGAPDSCCPARTKNRKKNLTRKNNIATGGEAEAASTYIKFIYIQYKSSPVFIATGAHALFVTRPKTTYQRDACVVFLITILCL